METRAAVAFEAKTPLGIAEVYLDGPRSAEVLVEVI
jgi:S-(hydroxymethyl)glutathione dehydrogenase/alcohol dehydrogenase